MDAQPMDTQPIVDTDSKAETSVGEDKLDTEKETKFCKDNGIFDFITPERAIELYKRIHAEGPPNLEWKFYGRRDPHDQRDGDESHDKDNDRPEEQNDESAKDQTVNTEFDFDESFTDISTDTASIVNESLQLKKRPEPGNEKKTNLSDIMSDIRKESG